MRLGAGEGAGGGQPVAHRIVAVAEGGAVGVLSRRQALDAIVAEAAPGGGQRGVGQPQRLGHRRAVARRVVAVQELRDQLLVRRPPLRDLRQAVRVVVAVGRRQPATRAGTPTSRRPW